MQLTSIDRKIIPELTAIWQFVVFVRVQEMKKTVFFSACLNFGVFSCRLINNLLFQVDHSIVMYLMSPQGKFVDYYGSRSVPTQDIVSGITRNMKNYKRLHG